MKKSSVTIKSELGPITIRGDESAVTRIELGARNGEPSQVVPAVLTEAARQIHAYLEGSLTEFTFPIRLEGSDFDQAVWRVARKIRYGQTKTYGWLAEKAGKPGAARAAGGAMGRNPLPLAIPCHRVITANGELGGFSCGLHWKKFLLKREGVL